MQPPSENTPPASPPEPHSQVNVPAMQLFRRLMESLPDRVYFKDTEGRFIAVNNAHAAALGLASPADAIGRTDFDFFEKNLARQKFADERDIIRTGVGFIGKEERTRSHAGAIRWVVTSKQPLLGDRGEIIGTFGISRDITDMKVARDALEAHHRLLETLIDILPCRIFIKDDEGRIRLTNAAYRQAVGVPDPADLEGRLLSEVINDPGAADAAADDQAVLDHGTSILNREEHDSSPLSRNSWVLLSKVPLRDAGGQIQGIVGMAADITAQKEAEARVIKAQHELEAKNQQMEAELAVARQLQTELMAAGMQSIRDRIDPDAPFAPTIGFHYEPCEYLAGDFFHAVPYSKRCFGVLLCDVMGHGVKAALVTTLIRGLFSGVRGRESNPAQVLEHLNDRLCSLLDRPPLPRFVTALYGVVDLDAGTLSMASAGHPWPLFQPTATGSVEPLTNEYCGPALGIVRGATYTPTVRKLERGDRFLLFTDGWIEEPNAEAEEFGPQRLTAALRRHAATPSDRVLAAIAGEITAFSGRTTRSDDLCGVLVGF